MAGVSFRGYRIMFTWVLLIIVVCCWLFDRQGLRKAYIREQLMRQEAQENGERLQSHINMLETTLTKTAEMYEQVVEVFEPDEEPELTDDDRPENGSSVPPE